MTYLQVSETDSRSVELRLDLIDKLVAVAEMTALHKSVPDDSPTKPYYLEMAKNLNVQVNEEMHKLGLHNLFEVRQRLELPIARIVNARKLALTSLQNVVDVGI